MSFPVFSSNHVSKLARWPSFCIFYGNTVTYKHPIAKRAYVLLVESGIRGGSYYCLRHASVYDGDRFQIIMISCSKNLFFIFHF